MPWGPVLSGSTVRERFGTCGSGRRCTRSRCEAGMAEADVRNFTINFGPLHPAGAYARRSWIIISSDVYSQPLYAKTFPVRL